MTEALHVYSGAASGRYLEQGAFQRCALLHLQGSPTD